MTIKFKYYLHDSYDSFERIDSIMTSATQLNEGFDPATIDYEELSEKMGRPFYEITLHCELDLETGKVEVVKTEI